MENSFKNQHIFEFYQSKTIQYNEEIIIKRRALHNEHDKCKS